MSRLPTLAKSRNKPATKAALPALTKKTQPASQEILIASKGKRAMTPAQLANLKPVQKGEVRNPQGINAFTGAKAEMMSFAQKLQAKAMRVLEKQLESDDERVAQAAAREVLDRAFGKPVAPVAETDAQGNDRPPPPPMVVVPVQVVNNR
jgi:hypothetical protein